MESIKIADFVYPDRADELEKRFDKAPKTPLLYLDNLRKRLEALGRPPTAELLQRIETFAARRGG